MYDVRVLTVRTATLVFWLGLVSSLMPAEKAAAAAAETNAKCDLIADGATLAVAYSKPCNFEGPMWNPTDEKLYFCCWCANEKTKQILRLDEPNKATTWLDSTIGANGLWYSPDNRMLMAEVYTHNIGSYKIGDKGPEDAKALAHSEKWNQPNDLCRAKRGDIYFTDPGSRNNKIPAVYRLSPGGQVTMAAADMTAPNGIITSPDDKWLYVSDSRQKLWKRYAIDANGAVGAGEVFFKPDTIDKSPPDGMTVDEQGNLYCTGLGGLWIVSPQGKALCFIKTEVFVSNVCFGGKDRKTLYLTGNGKVYNLAMKVRGTGK